MIKTPKTGDGRDFLQLIQAVLFLKFEELRKAAIASEVSHSETPYLDTRWRRYGAEPPQRVSGVVAATFPFSFLIQA
jgi:hypothetical protein